MKSYEHACGDWPEKSVPFGVDERSLILTYTHKSFVDYHFFDFRTGQRHTDFAEGLLPSRSY